MKKTTKDIMGMTITVEILDSEDQTILDNAFDYFREVDNRFSTYKDESEISRINRGELRLEDASPEMQEIFKSAEAMRLETDGYFNIQHNGSYDPSGLVKGWAIQRVADLLKKRGCHDFFIDAGGDIQISGLNPEEKPWRVGIRNPFSPDEIVKVIDLKPPMQAIATSGTYLRGQHIYDKTAKPVTEIVSLSVLGSTIYDADRYATAAFAMGREAITYLERLPELEGYVIDRNGQATATTGLAKFVVNGEV